MRMYIFLLFANIPFQILYSNQYYWVHFKDKHQVNFNPYEYFHPKAIERRLKHGISLYDSTDFPLQENYVRVVSELSDSLLAESRWLNAVAILTNEQNIKRIEQLPFVKNVQKYSVETSFLLKADKNFVEKIDVNLLKDQTSHLQAKEFHTRDVYGKNIRIAVFDAGFPGVDQLPYFKHLKNKIVKTYDFARKKDFVYAHDNHGTSVLSCIAGVHDTIPIGLATQASFLLAITEYSKREPFSEEKNWLLAAEWADKNGADIINSSLGYTHQRYFTNQMDGNTSLVSKAAKMAFEKGMLVVNAAGNDGDKDWKIIGTPADVDCVLSVGGIDPYTQYKISFSSFGPSIQKKIKPNVCAFGQVIAANEHNLHETFGTSFASPLIAGFAACVLQMDTTLTNAQLFQKIQQSATLYPYYDYAHGYGVPQASFFFSTKLDSLKTFTTYIENEMLQVQVLDDFMPSDTFNNMYEAVKSSISNHQYMYVHVENTDGYLRRYFLVDVYKKNALEIPLNDIQKGETIRIHYQGYTYTYKHVI